MASSFQSLTIHNHSFFYQCSGLNYGIETWFTTPPVLPPFEAPGLLARLNSIISAILRHLTKFVKRKFYPRYSTPRSACDCQPTLPFLLQHTSPLNIYFLTLLSLLQMSFSRLPPTISEFFGPCLVLDMYRYRAFRSSSSLLHTPDVVFSDCWHHKSRPDASSLFSEVFL